MDIRVEKRFDRIHRQGEWSWTPVVVSEVRLDRGGYHFLQVIEGVAPVAEHGLNSGDTLYIEG